MRKLVQTAQYHAADLLALRILGWFAITLLVGGGIVAAAAIYGHSRTAVPPAATDILPTNRSKIPKPLVDQRRRRRWELW